MWEETKKQLENIKIFNQFELVELNWFLISVVFKLLILSDPTLKPHHDENHSNFNAFFFYAQNHWISTFAHVLHSNVQIWISRQLGYLRFICKEWLCDATLRARVLLINQQQSSHLNSKQFVKITWKPMVAFSIYNILRITMHLSNCLRKWSIFSWFFVICSLSHHLYVSMWNFIRWWLHLRQRFRHQYTKDESAFER